MVIFSRYPRPLLSLNLSQQQPHFINTPRNICCLFSFSFADLLPASPAREWPCARSPVLLFNYDVLYSSPQVQVWSCPRRISRNSMKREFPRIAILVTFPWSNRPSLWPNLVLAPRRNIYRQLLFVCNFSSGHFILSLYIVQTCIGKSCLSCCKNCDLAVVSPLHLVWYKLSGCVRTAILILPHAKISPYLLERNNIFCNSYMVSTSAKLAVLVTFRPIKGDWHASL